MTALPSTRRRRNIIAGVVLAHAVLQPIALVLAANGPGRTPDVIGYPLFMLGPSQGALLAVWAVLGGGKHIWRVLPTVVGAILYSSLIRWADREWMPLTLGELCSVAAILAAARLIGLRLVRLSDLPSDTGPFQFYIRDLLLWTTGLAIVLSVWRCLPADWYPNLFRHVPGAFAIFGSLTLVAIVAFYSALGGWRLSVRILVAPLSVGLGAHIMVASRVGSRSEAFFAMLLACMAAWMIGTLWLVRFAGYRLMWKGRIDRSPV